MENKSRFLGIPGIAWGAGGLLLLLVAVVWAYFRSSGTGSVF